MDRYQGKESKSAKGTLGGAAKTDGSSDKKFGKSKAEKTVNKVTHPKRTAKRAAGKKAAKGAVKKIV